MLVKRSVNWLPLSVRIALILIGAARLSRRRKSVLLLSDLAVAAHGDPSRGAVDSQPGKIQTAASSRSDVTADKRVAAVLAVAPGVFGGVSNAPNRATTHIATADKAQKSPCRPRRVMARSSHRML